MCKQRKFNRLLKSPKVYYSLVVYSFCCLLMCLYLSVKGVPRVSDNVMQDIAKTRKQAARKLDKQKIPRRTDAQKKLDLFSHLHQYEREVSLTRNLSWVDWKRFETGSVVFINFNNLICFRFENSSIHPQTLRLGLQYADGIICGSNARCVALLSLLKIVRNKPKDLCFVFFRDKSFIQFKQLNECFAF